MSLQGVCMFLFVVRYMAHQLKSGDLQAFASAPVLIWREKARTVAVKGRPGLRQRHTPETP